MQSTSKVAGDWGTPKSPVPEEHTLITAIIEMAPVPLEDTSLCSFTFVTRNKSIVLLETLWQQNGENNRVSLMCTAHNVCFIIWWSKLISWPADRIRLIKRGGGGSVERSFLNLCAPFFLLQGIAGRIPDPHTLRVTFTWGDPKCQEPRTSEILLILLLTYCLYF